jgi:hypothetical protein
MIRKKGPGLYLALIKALGLGGLFSEVTEIIQGESMRRDRNIDKVTLKFSRRKQFIILSYLTFNFNCDSCR